jgi:hypothetical protein
VVLLLLVCGCSSGSRKIPVWGDVTYNGEPVLDGTITFTPIEGTPGPSTGGAIKDGHYEVAGEVGPISGGTYRVAITGTKRTGKKVHNVFQPGAPLRELSENYIPAIYNAQTTLKVTIAASRSANQHDFQLLSATAR